MNYTLNKAISLASAAVALGLTAPALGANVIYLTGSTAFRGNCYGVLSTAGAAGGLWDTAPDIATFGNANPAGCNYMLFHGFITNVETYVSCLWSGSEAGIASVAGNSVDNAPYGPLAGAPATFLKADGTVPYGNNTANPSSGELESGPRAADLSMADTSSAVSMSSSFTLHNFGKVGIVPFTWAKGIQSTPLPAWNRITNITDPQIRVLLGFPQPAAFLTGNPADTNYVYPVGRNKGSGTRVNCLASSGYGVTTPVVQFAVGGIPFNNTLTLVEVDNNGYESGGDVAKSLSVDGSQAQPDPNFGGTGWLAIGYLGTSDAQSASLTTANWLTLNGVMESDGAIEEGQYSYWGNEHLYGANGISGYKLAFGNTFIALIGNKLGGSVPTAHSSGISLRYMHAQKITDTAVPTRL